MVGDEPPKSGISRNSKYQPTAASKIGRARRMSRLSTVGTVSLVGKNRPSLWIYPRNLREYFPSADLMLKPSLALAVADWRSLAAVAALSAANSRRRWRMRPRWSSSSTRASSEAEEELSAPG